MSKTLRVWDPLVRIFHWSLVAFFFTAYLTGEEESRLHILSGYAVAGLITFRLLWGLVGSRHARFSDFVKGPGEVMAYIKGLLAGRPKHYLGHNPAGGWMIVAMLVTLVVVSYSGFKVYAIEEGAGPLAADLPQVQWVTTAQAHEDEDEDEEEGEGMAYGEAGEDEAAEEYWEEIHEAAANFMLLLVLLHVTGVVVSSRLHGENLVRAMITGNKSSEPGA